jgi:hypothetical protein
MQSDLSRSDANRDATKLTLARLTAFTSLVAAIMATLVAVALDAASIVPLLDGKNGYNPIRDFLSYQVDAQSGQLMTGAFLLLAAAAWSYAVAAFLSPIKPYDRVSVIATVLFGLGLFVGASFRAVPAAETSADHWLKSLTRIHDVGIGVGFVPPMIAAFIDQRRVVWSKTSGYLLTRVSFWLIASGAFGTAVAVAAVPSVEGLMQRVFVIGIVLWLITEAHQVLWSSVESER